MINLGASNYPVDTGRKLNAHKTFRRRPGRLLNVLCSFNLRPVSTGANYFSVSITSFRFLIMCNNFWIFVIFFIFLLSQNITMKRNKMRRNF